MAQGSSEREEKTTRVEVRPGLFMVKRRTRKEDGRYLLYYDFDRPRGADAGNGPEGER